MGQKKRKRNFNGFNFNLYELEQRNDGNNGNHNFPTEGNVCLLQKVGKYRQKKKHINYC